MNTNKLEENLGVVIKNKELLKVALTHRSFLNENRGEDKQNERMEFLGDAVLELIISEYLYNNFPDREEGDLTSFRSALVRTESLAQASRELNVGPHLRLAKGEEDSGGQDKDYILANAFEAILGAIYLDQGYEVAKNLVYRLLIPRIDEIVKNRLDIDGKTRIQEMAQEHYKITPIYEVIKEEGPDHDKVFTVVVKFEDKQIAQGIGSSKQRAEEDAAQKGIEYINKSLNK